MGNFVPFECGGNMLRIKKILFQIERNIKTVIKQDTLLGKDLFHLMLRQHPADIAMLLTRLTGRPRIALFKQLPEDFSIKVFEHLSEKFQASLLVKLESEYATAILKKIPADKLTELFDFLHDEDLKKYLRLLQKERRAQIISRLNFESESAGRIMNSDIVTLPKDFTVKKSVALIQRLGEKKELLQKIYVTNSEHRLVGYIKLDDLVINKPDIPLKKILHENELVIDAHEDQEDVARQMSHYELLSAPVVDKNHHFLGVITADEVLEVVKEEASEDVYKMSGLTPVEHSYFETPFWTLLWQRSPWLIGLLLLQSLSSFILSGYKDIVDKYFIISMFLTMLIGTGGNAGNQSSALVIRGLALGEMSRKNAFKVLLREFGISIVMASILVVVAFTRVYLFVHSFMSAIAVSSALFLIIVVSMSLGTLLPLLFERFNIDPAHSAAPFLATLMDIFGVLIYCFVVSKILG